MAANSGTSAIVTKNGDLYLFGKDSTQCDWSGQVIELKGQHISQVALGKAHIVALTRDGDVFTFGMNNKGQCGRDFTVPPRDALSAGAASSAASALAAGSSAIPAGQSPALGIIGSGLLGNAASGSVDPDVDANSDHDVDTDGQDGSLSELMCGSGKHKWKHDQCMVCAICGECTGYGSHCVSSGRPDRNPGMLCGCGSGDSGCAECGCCRTCAGEDGDIGGNEYFLSRAARRH